MIIDIERARELYPELSDERIKENLRALEESIRQLTNNKFHNPNISIKSTFTFEDNKIYGDFSKTYFNAGDRIEVVYSQLHDGLFDIVEATNDYLEVDGTFRRDDKKRTALIILIEYPADIKNGVASMIKYDNKMAGKEGIKSETVSRYTVNYFDVSANENIDGYPSAVISFINKYRKLRW